MTSTCEKCGEEVGIGDWFMCPHEPVLSHDAEVHAKERTVLWQHPGTGEYRYPGRNDVPMGPRLEKLGYQRKEFGSLAALQQHERETGARNEAVHFDAGSGGTFE